MANGATSADLAFKAAETASTRTKNNREVRKAIREIVAGAAVAMVEVGPVAVGVEAPAAVAVVTAVAADADAEALAEGAVVGAEAQAVEVEVPKAGAEAALVVGDAAPKGEVAPKVEDEANVDSQVLQPKELICGSPKRASTSESSHSTIYNSRCLFFSTKA